MVYTLELVTTLFCCECLETEGSCVKQTTWKLAQTTSPVFVDATKRLGATVLFFFNATTGSWSVVVSFRTTCTLLTAATTT